MTKNILAVLRAICPAITALLLLGSVLFAGDRKISFELDQFRQTDHINVIVKFRKDLSADAIKAARQAVANRIQEFDGDKVVDLNIIRATVYRARPAAAIRIAEYESVASISLDGEVQGALDFSAATVGAYAAHEIGWDGSGVGVAVLDSGVKEHEDLDGKIAYSERFVGKQATDKYGHGTHVAGIIASRGVAPGPSASRQFRGVAPGAHIINLKVLNDKGKGSDSAVIQAIERAIELKDVHDIRVMNLSLGRPVLESFTTDPLCQAVEEAWKAGITVVVSAGNLGRDNSFDNAGYGTITAPGNSPFAITVGAMKTASTTDRSDDWIATYSSKGPTAIDHVVKPDIVAPGNQVISLLASKGALKNVYPENIVTPSEYFEESNGGSNIYYRLSGTSMATPVVSGAAAVLLQKEPYLTPDQVKARLMKTAWRELPESSTAADPTTGETFTSQYDIFTIGAGYLDLTAALASNEIASEGYYAISPLAYFDEATGQVRIATDYVEVCGDSALWGTSGVCGDSAIWGTAAVWGTSSMWGTSAVWGSNVFVDGSSALWGTSAVWGSSEIEGFGAMWGTSAMWGSGAMWGTDLENVSAMQVLILGEDSATITTAQPLPSDPSPESTSSPSDDDGSSPGKGHGKK